LFSIRVPSYLSQAIGGSFDVCMEFGGVICPHSLNVRVVDQASYGFLAAHGEVLNVFARSQLRPKHPGATLLPDSVWVRGLPFDRLSILSWSTATHHCKESNGPPPNLKASPHIVGPGIPCSALGPLTLLSEAPQDGGVEGAFRCPFSGEECTRLTRHET
jgi:hypothetical protein